VVYDTIKNTYSHPTADWVFEQVRHTLPKVSLGTVYRNLGVLKEEGLVNEIFGNDRRAHYDADISPHAHFICESCDQIIDVRNVKTIDWKTLKDLVGCEVADQKVRLRILTDPLQFSVLNSRFLIPTLLEGGF